MRHARLDYFNSWKLPVTIGAVIAATLAASLGTAEMNLNVQSAAAAGAPAQPFWTQSTPTPPAVTQTAPPTSGPSWHPHGAKPAPAMQVTVTDPAHGCVILHRDGADMTVKTTQVNPGQGQIVNAVQINAVNPSGDVRASGPAYNVGGTEWHRGLHLASNSPVGDWAAVAVASLTSTNGTETKYADHPFCVQRDAYSGWVHVSNDHPYQGTRITFTGDFMGLNAKGDRYEPQARERIHLVYRDNNNHARDFGWATTNHRGRWAKTILAPGEPGGEFFVTFTGSKTFAPFVSDGVLVGYAQS